ncbi:DUF475 domain-containing protein [Bombilactobacillus thymidiniphilus]|uniref:DUF475 domain-containing protein n=1 Tax=Bombilactobacillus thymidiniphilus TaxID=2923363 RepID=A0ABY4PFA1_9LACO|nr:DUF475 domain-containing protein [Bombilactobacillus thymidiniphilus]UQS84201.1 DUF475 domain-containing protein [Bombilactobacillus thymidiniphilus]
MNFIINLYKPFFDLHNWQQVITSPSDWVLILSLIVMECLLSVDNSIVLAAQAHTLETKKEQEEALFYGIWGAFIFRFLIIGVATFLIKLWWIKVLGAIYLVYMAVSFFYKKSHSSKKKNKMFKIKGLKPLLQVIISVEFTDIMFSLDSVLTLVAISNNPVIILIGSIVGIIAMRGVAEVIIKLMNKIPELEPMAYILILVIAVKLFLSIPAIDIEINNSIFVIILVIAFATTFIVHFLRKKQTRK